MKTRTLVTVTVGLLLSALATGIVAHLCAAASWRQHIPSLREAFHYALREEIRKRDTVDIPIWQSPYVKKGLWEDPIPDSVKVSVKEGTRVFRIPREKFENSLEKDKIKRIVLSVLLTQLDSLNAEGLNAGWKDTLAATQVVVDSIYTRITVTDFYLHPHRHYSAGWHSRIKADSLFSYYMGDRCEVEATALAVKPSVWRLLSNWQQFFCLGTFALFITLWLFINKKLLRPSRRQVPPPAEPELPATHLEIPPASNEVLRLSADIYFDCHTLTLHGNGCSCKLQPQAAALFEAFLRAPGYTLSATDIQRSLWPDNSGTQDRIYSAINRLRKAIEAFPGIDITSGSTSYRLHISQTRS